MAAAYDAPLPADLDLEGSYTIRVTAIDPTTGALVSGVTVANLVMMVNTLGGTTPDQLAVGQFQLVPGPGG
jgi:hypothetical protein